MEALYFVPGICGVIRRWLSWSFCLNWIQLHLLGALTLPWIFSWISKWQSSEFRINWILHFVGGTKLGCWSAIHMSEKAFFRKIRKLLYVPSGNFCFADVNMTWGDRSTGYIHVAAMSILFNLLQFPHIWHVR
jgi:hypothetical protein